MRPPRRTLSTVLLVMSLVLADCVSRELPGDATGGGSCDGLNEGVVQSADPCVPLGRECPQGCYPIRGALRFDLARQCRQRVEDPPVACYQAASIKKDAEVCCVDTTHGDLYHFSQWPGDCRDIPAAVPLRACVIGCDVPGRVQ